jgi:hypothetical protein
MIKIYLRALSICVVIAFWIMRFKQDVWTLLAAFAVLYLALDREMYLYFLDQAAFPCEPMQPKEPDHADTEIRIENLRPDSNVVFWAAEASEEIVSNPWKAYGTNSNSGVARSDAHGTVVLRVRKPASYSTPMGKTLNPHVHYRVCDRPGMLGAVRTIQVDGK